MSARNASRNTVFTPVRPACRNDLHCFVMKTIKIAMLAPALLVATFAQVSRNSEFEVASIKTNAPQTGFHFAADGVSGGPGTADPGIFRCSKCSVATLIVKAFKLQPYQFPARASFTDNTYDVVAKIPTGASEEEFSVMLQNLLKDRFGLTWHFDDKQMKGYHLVVGKNGPKLRESTDAALAPAPDQHRSGETGSHNHTGPVVFGTSASFRAANQTTTDLARILSDQIGVPIDDQTGLTGKYDIFLRWSRNTAQAGTHSDTAFSGGTGHVGHDGGDSAASGSAADTSGPTLFDALQQQLGLKLVASEQALAHLFVVDRVAQRPTEN
jgi:uncharacterized protein (TIGR03435 family)